MQIVFWIRLQKHAPDEVRQAFLEAEKETGGALTVFGLWISNDGKQAYMTQMGIDRFVRWYHGVDIPHLLC